MAKDLVIGIDCSTTASKAIVFDKRGLAVAEGRCALPLFMPRPGWHEQPAESWWTATIQALREAMAHIDPQRLAALSIAHQRETFVPVDETGQPLRHAIVWMDERSRAVLPEIARACSPVRFHRISGKPLSGNLSIGKILWLKENEPEVFERAVRFLDVHAFLVHRLTGEFRTSWGSADPMGLFDTQQHCWARELVASVGLHLEQLPAVHSPGQIIGTVTRECSAACGLPVGLPVVAGLGDGQAAGLGANVTCSGVAYLSLGTSVISGTLAKSYVTDRAFRTMTSAQSGMFLLETVLLSGTYILSWFLEHWACAGAGLSTMEEFEVAIQDIPPGAQGLMLVPYWNSAMNPYWDAGASGIVAGWRGFHDRRHIYRAILEGIALELRLHASGVEAALEQPIEYFIGTGGGARSTVWLQIIADVTGKPIFRSRNVETAALGAAILAAQAAGLYGNVQEAAEAMTCTEARSFEPDVRRHDIYSRLYEQVYRHLFPSLQPYLDRLTELTEGLR